MADSALDYPTDDVKCAHYLAPILMKMWSTPSPVLVDTLLDTLEGHGVSTAKSKPVWTFYRRAETAGEQIKMVEDIALPIKKLKKKVADGEMKPDYVVTFGLQQKDCSNPFLNPPRPSRGAWSAD
ncbi:hypothetical protein V5O48_006413 [Marasmius crinis-equi]|uniref:Uncharacterized protein n=1 Tax=Marasmius crinis-equi TaxID=585013 RepID=A0ABR3FK79_9AGAR